MYVKFTSCIQSAKCLIISSWIGEIYRRYTEFWIYLCGVIFFRITPEIKEIQLDTSSITTIFSGYYLNIFEILDKLLSRVFLINDFFHLIEIKNTVILKKIYLIDKELMKVFLIADIASKSIIWKCKWKVQSWNILKIIYKTVKGWKIKI